MFTLNEFLAIVLGLAGLILVVCAMAVTSREAVADWSQERRLITATAAGISSSLLWVPANYFEAHTSASVASLWSFVSTSHFGFLVALLTATLTVICSSLGYVRLYQSRQSTKRVTSATAVRPHSHLTAA